MICFGVLSIRLSSSHYSGHEYDELTFLHVWCFFGKKVCFFKNEILITDGLKGLEAISSEVFGRFPLLAQKRRDQR
jgi:hypothetical protein